MLGADCAFGAAEAPKLSSRFCSGLPFRARWLNVVNALQTPPLTLSLPFCPLCRLALGSAITRQEAAELSVGYYASEMLLHAEPAAARLLGGAHPSLAAPQPPGTSGCAVVAPDGGSSDRLAVEVVAEQCFQPSDWPWQNCSAWALTDALSGTALRFLDEAGTPRPRRLPLLPGVNCAFGIATAAGGRAWSGLIVCAGCWFCVASPSLDAAHAHSK